MSIDTDRQVVAAVNLTSGLFVAYLGVLKFGKAYVLAEDDVIGVYSGWVGFEDRFPAGQGFTAVARLAADADDDAVRAECRRAAAERGLHHPAALAVLDAFMVRVSGCGARAADLAAGKAPGGPLAGLAAAVGPETPPAAPNPAEGKPGPFPGTGRTQKELWFDEGGDGKTDPGETR